MTVSFPWYDLASVRWANDAIWRATGLGGTLDRTTPVEEQWRADDLVVSQACGLDLFLTDAPIEPVLAPVFDLDCEDGCYYSVLVGSRDGVAAVNSLSSRSGFTALHTICEPSAMLVTGSHAASLAAVRAGRADMACIDAVTWHILERDQPEATRDVAVLERTCSAPAPPYVVRKGGEGRAVAHRIAAAMQDVTLKAAREALLLRGVIPVSMDDYAPVRAEYRAVASRTSIDMRKVP
ncbi:MAG: PhnD/SsuA/transferrin family substrate-binding protein [Gammaproteobacteria bacterium]|nr:PhnD/SsuA/transferrin family substrate-binding protein [Gammaproteobacteria bacterium]